MAQLDNKDLELLIILQEKPMANDSTLARLVNLSSPTVKRRIDKLYENKAIERIQALLNYPALKLKTVSAFIDVPYSKVIQVQGKLNSYPYIYYNIRCVGEMNGIHATFRVPKSGISSIEKFLQLMINHQLASKFVLYSHEDDEVRSRPRFMVYNSTTNSWDFDFSKWVDKTPEQLKRGFDEPIEPKIEASFTDLDKVDIEILSILSLNSRIKNVEILEKIPQIISPQRLSDRLRFLRKHFVSNYRVYLNWNAIFGFMGLLFDCKADVSKKFYYKTLLRVNPPPFETIFRETDRGFLLYLVCPTSHVYPAIDTLFSRLEDVKFYMLDYESATRISLNPTIFDAENKKWKVPETIK